MLEKNRFNRFIAKSNENLDLNVDLLLKRDMKQRHLFSHTVCLKNERLSTDCREILLNIA